MFAAFHKDWTDRTRDIAETLKLIEIMKYRY